MCVLFSINLQFQKQSRPQSKTITESLVLYSSQCSGQQFIFWNNIEHQHTQLSVIRLLVQYCKFRNRLIALRCYAQFTWALSVMIHSKSVSSTQARLCASLCDGWNFKTSMWRCLFLPVQSHCKFGSKWLLSCTFSNANIFHISSPKRRKVSLSLLNYFSNGKILLLR